MNTPILPLAMVCALLLGGCSETPVLDSNLTFPDDLSAPKRTAVDYKLLNKLPKPDTRTDEMTSQGLYYSANGHACKRISSTQVVCYINGRWLQTTNIFKHR